MKRAIIPLLLTALGLGCSSLPPEPLIEYRTIEVVRDRYVPVPERLTQRVEIVDLSADFDLHELGAAYKAQRIRAQQCNGQLTEIEGLGE